MSKPKRPALPESARPLSEQQNASRGWSRKGYIPQRGRRLPPSGCIAKTFKQSKSVRDTFCMWTFMRDSSPFPGGQAAAPLCSWPEWRSWRGNVCPARTGLAEAPTVPSEDRDVPYSASGQVRIAIRKQTCAKLGKSQGPQPEIGSFSSRLRTGQTSPPRAIKTTGHAKRPNRTTEPNSVRDPHGGCGVSIDTAVAVPAPGRPSPSHRNDHSAGPSWDKIRMHRLRKDRRRTRWGLGRLQSPNGAVSPTCRIANDVSRIKPMCDTLHRDRPCRLHHENHTARRSPAALHPLRLFVPTVPPPRCALWKA